MRYLKRDGEFETYNNIASVTSMYTLRKNSGTKTANQIYRLLSVHLQKQYTRIFQIHRHHYSLGQQTTDVHARESAKRKPVFLHHEIS